MTGHDLAILDSLWGVSDRPRSLEGCRFINEDLGQVSIGPGLVPDAIVQVRNCQFLRCVATGPFHIGPAVVLDDVVFDDVMSDMPISIRTPVVLRNVVFRSERKVPGLSVRSHDILYKEYIGKSAEGPLSSSQSELRRAWASAAMPGADCMLDFSGLKSDDVEVVGIPLSKLRWNAERHVPVRACWRESEVWRHIGVYDFWSSRVARLRHFGEVEGVYSFPSPDSKRYAQAEEGKKILIEYGLLRS